MKISAGPWEPSSRTRARVDDLIQSYRQVVVNNLEPLLEAYYPELLGEAAVVEYRKMVELSTKMTVVGHACSEIAGYEYDERRQRIACLYGGCCFLADSFIDDFGESATREYLARFERLLSEGWFEVRTARERLFYVIISRLFSERDVFDPNVRQAILNVYEAQRLDVELRLDPGRLDGLSRRRRLEALKQCARDRSGHAILLLTAFLVPRVPVGRVSLIFAAGALIMHIDDHGDCFSDLGDRRITYMNQVRDPVRALRGIFWSHIQRLFHGLPGGSGRDLMIGFLTRYYLTRIEKHRQQKARGGYAWAVYE